MDVGPERRMSSDITHQLPLVQDSLSLNLSLGLNDAL